MRLLIVSIVAVCCAAPVLADGFGFRTPSGNIYCNGEALDPYLGCTIVNREAGSAPSGLGSCPAGRELNVEINETGSVRVECGRAAGRLSTYTDIANYGVSANFGRITCRSERTGFSCRNADGHGFTLSRRAQQVF